MMPDNFVYETSNNRLQRFVALIVVAIIICAGIYLLIGNLRLAHSGDESMLARFTPNIVHDLTPIKQFVISIMSGMIIFPIPNELVFAVGLQQGNPVWLSIACAVIGFTFGNIITYLLGLKLSKQVVYLLSTKQIYELRRKVNRYGVFAIMLVNVIPSPSDILTFGLGIARYNFKRLFLVLIAANLVKFTVIAYVMKLF